MSYEAEEIAERLRSARESRGLSQRELSARTGIPQGQISRIEQGAVDLRLSTLLALSRVLELEPALIPRALIPAVNALTRQSALKNGRIDKARTKAILTRTLQKLRGAEEQERSINIIAGLENTLHFLGHISLDTLDETETAALSKALDQLDKAEPQGKSFTHAVKTLRDIRNRLAHAESNPGAGTRPAYSLDAEDADG